MRSMWIEARLVGRSIAVWSLSWVAPRVEMDRLMSAVSKICGIDAPNDSAAPLTRFVAPGPTVASATHGRPFTRA